jgi:hypothetical protein
MICSISMQKSARIAGDLITSNSDPQPSYGVYRLSVFIWCVESSCTKIELKTQQFCYLFRKVSKLKIVTIALSHSVSVSTWIDRGFMKFVETWQFSLTFNIMRHIFLFWPRFFFVGFMNFWKFLVLSKKKSVNHKIDYK